MSLSNRLPPDVCFVGQAEAALLSCFVASCRLGRFWRRWESMEANRANATGEVDYLEGEARDMWWGL
jgi:hypothetical protein